MLKFIVVLALFVACASAGLYDEYAEKEGVDAQKQRAEVGPCQPTTQDILGPYYKRNAPFQPLGPKWPSVCRNLPAHDRLFLNGTIRQLRSGEGCAGTPVKALMDIWSADYNGAYSNISPQSPDFTCRVRIYTNNDGFYNFDSLYPGRYDDGGYRPAHIHFTITPVDRLNRPIGKPFTTQLYFAQDTYLGLADSCQRCGSKNANQIATLDHSTGDYKSLLGSWNVILPAEN